MLRHPRRGWRSLSGRQLADRDPTLQRTANRIPLEAGAGDDFDLRERFICEPAPGIERLLDADQVESHLFEGGLLVDARAPARFRGEEEPMDRVAGHVPGAINRPFASNMIDGRFKSPMQLADEFRALLAGRDPATTVLMCGSGVTACHNLLAMERAGLKGAKLFTGSWSGWIQDPSRPVARGA